MKFHKVNFKLILVLDDWGFSCAILLVWMSLCFTDVKTTLVEVMYWCCQVTSHYMNKCWPRSKPPYGATRPQWFRKKSANSNRANNWRNHFRSLLCLQSNYWEEPNYIFMKRLWHGDFSPLPALLEGIYTSNRSVSPTKCQLCWGLIFPDVSLNKLLSKQPPVIWDIMTPMRLHCSGMEKSG